VAPSRPGGTHSAFFYSSAERLTSSPVAIEYVLVDAQGDSARSLVAEYSLTGGGQWLPATEGPGGSGTTDLAASPEGTPHTFSWDAREDGACSDNAIFRISVPYQAPDRVGGPIQQAGLSTMTPPFRVGGPIVTWYRDSDRDGHGDVSNTARSCRHPDGYVEAADDCGDHDAAIHPGAVELPGNFVDENCDGDRGTCDPCAGWKNHGQFVRCVSHAVDDLVKSGEITEIQARHLVSDAARSDIGKPSYVAAAECRETPVVECDGCDRRWTGSTPRYR